MQTVKAIAAAYHRVCYNVGYIDVLNFDLDYTKVMCF